MTDPTAPYAAWRAAAFLPLSAFSITGLWDIRTFLTADTLGFA